MDCRNQSAETKQKETIKLRRLYGLHKNKTQSYSIKCIPPAKHCIQCTIH